MKEEYKGVVLALAVIFVLAMIPIGIGIHNDYKRKHRVMSPEQRKEVVDKSKAAGLDYCRDVVMYLNEAASARTVQRRANMLSEAWTHATGASTEFYIVDKWTEVYKGGSDKMDAVAEIISSEEDKYTDMPYNERVMKTSYQWVIDKVWDVIDMYYQ